MPDRDFFSQIETDESNSGGNKSETRIPVIAEFLSIEKKQVETGSVHVAKHVLEQQEIVNVSLRSVGYEIEHIAKNEFVDDALPTARQEGDTWIIPVLKEVVVKRIMLTEEIRITKKTAQRNEQHEVMLRSEQVEVTRTPIPGELQTGVMI